jgi:hypothetical protein
MQHDGVMEVSSAACTTDSDSLTSPSILLYTIEASALVSVLFWQALRCEFSIAALFLRDLVTMVPRQTALLATLPERSK